MNLPLGYTQSDLTERVIRVDERDLNLGAAGKIEVHEAGLLHRAFSVFLFDDEGRLLLQRRARGKYHSGGLWANSCCGHPRPGEQTRLAAIRRTQEELGISVDLTESFRFRYRVELGNGLIENELVHMMFGRFHGTPRPDPSEVSQTRWISLDDAAREAADAPETIAVWFRLYLETCPGQLAASARALSEPSEPEPSKHG